MTIEFFYKETEKPVKDPSDYNIDYEGDVFEISHEYDETFVNYNPNIGWRVIDG